MRMYFITESCKIIRQEGILSWLKRLFRRAFFEGSTVIAWGYHAIYGPEERFTKADLDRGLLPRSVPASFSDDDLRRIIWSYKAAKKVQASQPAEYAVTGDWAAIVEEQHREMTAAIEAEDPGRLRQILTNFARDKISRGLSLAGNIPHSFLDKLHMVKAYNRTYVVWKRMTGFPDAVLEYPKEIGNMHGMDSGGKAIMLPAFHQSYFAQSIGTLLASKGTARTTVVEIGGGYGSFAYHLFRDTKLNAAYVSLDIPEMCVISAYFLRSCFPDKKLLLYGEGPVDAAALREYDIIILPNFALKDLPPACCDLVFNSHSMTQMTPATIKEYLRQIDRTCTGFFYHANDETLRTNQAGDATYVNLNAPEYELPADRFRRLYRIPELIRNDGYLSPEFTSWEYLYERIGN